MLEAKKQKSVAKNVVYNVLYRVMNMFFPLVTAVYVSHILQASGVGKVGTAQNIVQYFVLLAPLGIANYGTREIAKIRDCQPETEKLFSELFLINTISSLLCIFAYYSLVLGLDYFSAERKLYAVAGIPIIFNLINVEWFYHGYEDYGYIAIRSIIVKLLSLLAIFAFVKTQEDYISYALIYTLGIAGNYVFNAVNLLRRGIRFSWKNVSIKQHMPPILFLLCSNIAIELYTLLDTTMLGYLCEDSVVGYYTNSIKLVKIIVSLVGAIGSVLLPRLSYYRNRNMIDACNKLLNQITQVMLFFAVPCGVGVAVLAEQLIEVLFGSSFLPAVPTVRIATVLIYVLGFSNLFGTQVLLTFNQEKKLLICTCIGAVSNILMNSILIPLFYHNGAVVASVVSECLVTFSTILFSRKYVNVQIPFAFVLKTGISASVMAACVAWMRELIPSDRLCLLISITLGAAIYILSGFVFRNPLLVEAKRMLENRRRV